MTNAFANVDLEPLLVSAPALRRLIGCTSSPARLTREPIPAADCELQEARRDDWLWLGPSRRFDFSLRDPPRPTIDPTLASSTSSEPVCFSRAVLTQAPQIEALGSFSPRRGGKGPLKSVQRYWRGAFSVRSGESEERRGERGRAPAAPVSSPADEEEVDPECGERGEGEEMRLHIGNRA